MKKVLMILTSHRLDCFSLCMDLLIHGGSIRSFDHVVLLLNGVVGRHRAYIEDLMRDHPEVPWDLIEGPRGKGFRISGLQNQCVERYPEGLYFKIDEDTFVSSDWAEALEETHRAHRDDPALSLVTPLIPNNSLGSFHLFHLFPELAQAYTDRFGEPVTDACMGPVWKRPDIATWLMRRWISLAAGHERLRALDAERHATFTGRFSINCICYDYRHYQELGGVQEHDERGWGEWIEAHQKKVVIDRRSLCHHYSFGPQQDWMDRSHLLEELREANLPASLHPGALAREGARLRRVLGQGPVAVRRKIGALKGAG